MTAGALDAEAIHRSDALRDDADHPTVRSGHPMDAQSPNYRYITDNLRIGQF